MAVYFQDFLTSYKAKKRSLSRGRLSVLYGLILEFKQACRRPMSPYSVLIIKLQAIHKEATRLELLGGDVMKKWGPELTLAKVESVQTRSLFIRTAKKRARQDLSDVGLIRTKHMRVSAMALESKVSLSGKVPVFVDLIDHDGWESVSDTSESSTADEAWVKQVYVVGNQFVSEQRLDTEIKLVDGHSARSKAGASTELKSRLELQWASRHSSPTSLGSAPTREEPVFETVVSISVREPLDALMKLREVHPDWFDAVALKKLTGSPLTGAFYTGDMPATVRHFLDTDPHIKRAFYRFARDRSLRVKLRERARDARYAEEDPLDRRAFVRSIESRWYPERREVLNLAECGAGKYPEVLRRLIGVKHGLVTGGLSDDVYTSETLASMGLDAAALVSISDATYCSIVDGWNPGNYLGPSLWGMPIDMICTLVSLGHLYKGAGSIEDRRERALEVTMGSLGATKSGIDLVQLFATTKVLKGTSYGLGVVGGTYATVKSSKEFIEVKGIKDRFELIVENNPFFTKLFNHLHKVRKNHPLLVYRDKILNGKLGRRELRAVVGAVSGLVDISSGVYGIALLCGAAAVPAVGWALAGLGILAAVGTIGYKLGRRQYRERQYKGMVIKQPDLYPAYFRTTGEYYRAHVSTYLHRGLIRPVDDLHLEIAGALAWSLFGGDINNLQGAVVETDITGMMELIKG